MKIPFEATISGAYRFAFTNFLSILGVAWFPALVLCALLGGLVYISLHDIQAFLKAIADAEQVARHATPGSPEAQAATGPIFATIASLVGRYVLAILIIVVIRAMISVGVMRKALGLHPEPVFFFFSLGGQVWRLIGAYILLYLMAYGVALVLALAVMAVYTVLQNVAPNLQILATVVLGIVAVCWFLYAAVRIVFFIPAVVVAEDSIGIGRSWQLGRGNFWRIVGIYLLVTVPLAFAVNIVLFTAVQIAMGPGVGIAPAQSADPAEAARVFGQMLDVLVKIGPIILVVELVSLILQAGLVNGATAIAYNLVTGSAGEREPA